MGVSSSSSEVPKKTAPKSPSVKKKINEFFSKDGKFLIMKLLVVAVPGAPPHPPPLHRHRPCAERQHQSGPRGPPLHLRHQPPHHHCRLCAQGPAPPPLLPCLLHHQRPPL